MQYTLPVLPKASVGATITIPDVATLVKPPNTALPNIASTFGATLNSLASALPVLSLPSGIPNPFGGLQAATSVFKKKNTVVDIGSAGAWAPPLTVMSPSIPSSASILQPTYAQGARGSL